MARFTYLYTNDAGYNSNIVLDENTAIAGGFTLSTDPELTQITRRARSKIRGVYGEATVSGKLRHKFLPCHSNDQLDSVFDAGTFTVAGVTYTTTSRRGEFWKRVI